MKILFITFYWPPSGRATLHWPLAMIRNFAKEGIETKVLTVDEDNFTQKDISLLPLIPSGLKVFKSKANDPFNYYKKFIGKNKNESLVSSEVISKTNNSIAHKISVWIRMNLFVPDARIGWYFSAMKMAKKIFSTDKFDAVVSIGPPHTAHLIGRKISKKYNLPHVPVLIDPWTDIAYYKGFKRNYFTLKIDNKLEKKVMLDASKVIFVTKETEKDFISKYDFLKGKTKLFYWGYNESDFQKINFNGVKPKDKTILHAGNIFDFQNPIGLWKNIKNEIAKGNNLKIKFVGTVSPLIKNSLFENGLESVTEYLGFLPYEEVLREMVSANYLLVCSTEPRHLPGKLFEYARTGNKVIAFNNENFEMGEFIKEGNLGIQLPYNYNGLDIFEKLENVIPNPEIAKKYSRENIAVDFAKLLKNLI